MKSVSMSGSLRENVGKKDAKKQRREGYIPCVVYGGKEQLHFTMDERNFKKILFTPEVYIVNLDLGGKSYQTLLQDIQYHPVTDKILHADFLEIIQGKAVKLSIPVELTGSAAGVIKGGRLVQKLRKVHVKGLVEDIPDKLQIDISALEIGDTIKISDLKLDKLELLDIPTEMVVGVRTTRVIVEEVEEEGEEGAAEGAASPAEGEGKHEGEEAK